MHALFALACAALLRTSTEEPLRTDERPRVAFVFAGSARSFVHPLVHESIRVNLVQALCPARDCDKHVFMLIGSNDNVHRDSSGLAVKSSKGIMLELPLSDIRAIQHSANRTSVEDGRLSSTTLHTEWYKIGSESERDAMRRAFGSFRHRIFRELDPRRYSMYFSRWSSYQMAVREEEQSGRAFDWVVMARLDCMWGAPAPHISAFSPKKVWLLDRWQMEYPDALAIIPRDKADAYFSMNALLNPNVFCLGGPNFDVTSAEPDNLRALGFSEDQFQAVKDELCVSRYGGEHAHGMGLSETILAQKLQVGGIRHIVHANGSRGGSLGFAPLFMLIVRAPLTPDCANLRTDFIVQSLQEDLFSVSNLFPACRLLFSDMKLEKSVTNWIVSSACTPMKEGSVRDYSGDCLLNRFVSDWNFLPFRILGDAASCLTFARVWWGSAHNYKYYYTLKFLPCIDTEKFLDVFGSNVTAKYGMSQMFHFYPLFKGLQAIKFADVNNDAVLCMVNMTVKVNGSARHILAGRPCQSRSGETVPLRVELESGRDIKRRVRRARARGTSQLLNSKERAAFTTSDSAKCLTRSYGGDSNSSDIVFTDCLPEPAKKSQTFTILRTQAIRQIF